MNPEKFNTNESEVVSQASAVEGKDEGKSVELEALSYMDDSGIREILNDSGVVEVGEVMESADFEVIRRRAEILLEKDLNLTLENALVVAYFDRKEHEEKLDPETIFAIAGDSDLVSLFSRITGEKMTDEKVEMVIKYLEGLDDDNSPLSEKLAKWGEVRREALN